MYVYTSIGLDLRPKILGTLLVVEVKKEDTTMIITDVTCLLFFTVLSKYDNPVVSNDGNFHACCGPPQWPSHCSIKTGTSL